MKIRSYETAERNPCQRNDNKPDWLHSRKQIISSTDTVIHKLLMTYCERLDNNVIGNPFTYHTRYNY